MSEKEEAAKSEIQILRDAFEGMKGRQPKSDQELKEWLATDEGKEATMFESTSFSRFRCFAPISGHLPARVTRRLWANRRHSLRGDAPCGFASGLVGRRGRQNELEQRAAFAVRRRRQLTAVVLSDHAANRESHSHSVRLGRKERGKYVLQFLRINSRSRVLYCNCNCIVTQKAS